MSVHFHSNKWTITVFPLQLGSYWAKAVPIQQPMAKTNQKAFIPTYKLLSRIALLISSASSSLASNRPEANDTVPFYPIFIDFKTKRRSGQSVLFVLDQCHDDVRAVRLSLANKYVTKIHNPRTTVVIYCPLLLTLLKKKKFFFSFFQKWQFIITEYKL